MRRLLSIFSTVIIVWAFAQLAFASAPNIMGVWSRTDGKSRVKIAACEDKICATNIWIAPGVTEEQVGDVLEMTLKSAEDGSLNGEAFDKRRDQHYSMNISVSGSALTTKGCIIGGLLCKSSVWLHAE